MNRPFHLFQNLLGRLNAMYHRICRVDKLLRHIHIRILPLHFQRRFQALFNAFANIAIVVNKDNLCAIMPNKFSAFLAHRIWHDNDRFISFYCAHQSQSDSLIPAGRLYNHRILSDKALPFGLRYHIIGCARFN